jgi:hypothetical protein
MSTAVDTTKVTERRTLHFADLDALAAEVDRLAQAKEIRHLGNWTPGQIVAHLAIAMNNSIDGFPVMMPGVARFFLRLLFKKRFLTRTMTPGFKLPAKAAEKLIPPPVPLEEGVQNFRKARERLRKETQRAPNPAIGKLTIDEWNQLHCRHAELHLSFLVPG